MKIQVTVGLGDEVWVQLTPEGERHLLAYYESVPGLNADSAFNHCKDGWWRFRLLDLMYIFGSKCHPGYLSLFEESTITLTDPNT